MNTKSQQYVIIMVWHKN